MHTHTVFSDGDFLPKQVVDCAVGAGVKLIAVTDHDNMLACGEVSALSKAAGIRAVDGIEVSAYCGSVKFHTLGYGVDRAKFKLFTDRLYEGSFIRAADVIKKLDGMGLHLTMDEIIAERYSPDAPVHGMHIARAAVKLGYAKCCEEFFKNYLGENRPAFSVAGRPTPEEAVKAIVGAGGFASVAHPGRIDMDGETLKEKLKSLKDVGLGGIEVYYSTHTEEKTEYYYKLAEELSLIATGGSDTHGPAGTRKIGTPAFYADDALLEKLNVEKISE